MPQLIRVDKLGKCYGFREIFRDVTFAVEEREKTALVGPNGVGKSTVLRILAGVDEPTSGEVKYSGPVSRGYVPQDPEFPDLTPFEILSAEERRLSGGTQSEALEALSRFGFRGHEGELPISQLSGGQKTRLALAKAWITRPEVLLLDEPTNHLDHEGLTWLEHFIRGYDGTVLLVSHDRYFLDRTISRVIELSPVGARNYPGNYTAYREAKEAEFAAQMARYESEEKKIRKIEAAIDRQMRWFEKSHRDAGKQTEIRMGTKEFYRARAKRIARQAKSSIKRLEAMKERSVEKPHPEQGISLQGFQEGQSGRRMILAEALSKAYDKPLFTGAKFTVFRGDKVGVIGPNGAGKTTLLKMILGEESPTGGTLWVSPGAKIGYLEQELSCLDRGATLLEEVLKTFPQQTAESVTRARTMLGCFLFTSDNVEKSIAILSTGEKKRVAIVKLLLSAFNLLLLDEPTEHLDLPAREKLEEALAAYGGTLVLVSHDRYLLERVCNVVLAIEDGRIDVYPGGYGSYLEKRAGSGSPSQAEAEVLTGECLLLETRLAMLSSKLAGLSQEKPEYHQVETEYLEISRQLRKLRLRK